MKTIIRGLGYEPPVAPEPKTTASAKRNPEPKRKLMPKPVSESADETVDLATAQTQNPADQHPGEYGLVLRKKERVIRYCR